MSSPLFPPELQFFSRTGQPLAGGFLFLYQPNTLVQKIAWQDPNKKAVVSFPIVLDSGGFAGELWGEGQYRARVLDSNNNLVSDTLTTSALSESAVSAVMLPILGAQTIQSAQTLLGIPQLINAAISNIELISGATGPIGITGSVGATGVIGSTGASGPAGASGISVGEIRTGVYTSPDGTFNITFSPQFPTECTSFILSSFLVPLGPIFIEYLSISATGITGTFWDNSNFVDPTTIAIPGVYGWTAIGF